MKRSILDKLNTKQPVPEMGGAYYPVAVIETTAKCNEVGCDNTADRMIAIDDVVYLVCRETLEKFGTFSGAWKEASA